MTETLRQLQEKIQTLDFSINNPNIQHIITQEVERWVSSYEEKKKMSLHDCYGGPGDIPDEITIDDIMYSPPHILQQIEQRTTAGKSILKKIYAGYGSFLSPPEEQIDLRETVSRFVTSIPPEQNIDVTIISCMCGQHSKSYRDMLNDIIAMDPDSSTLALGWVEAIQKLYQTKN